MSTIETILTRATKDPALAELLFADPEPNSRPSLPKTAGHFPWTWTGSSAD